MAKFRIDIKINKPVKVIYQAFVEPGNILKWSTDLEKFELVNGEFDEIGAVVHLHYKQNNRTYILEDKLEYLDPGKKIISQVSGESLIVIVETIFNSIDEESTEMIMVWNGKGKKALKFLLPFLKNKIKNRALLELNMFKKLVEEYGVKFK